MTNASFDYTVGDFNYIEHPDGAQKLRLFMPVGATGPVPLVVDLHGGAWCNGDLKDCEPREEGQSPVPGMTGVSLETSLGLMRGIGWKVHLPARFSFSQEIARFASLS